MTSTHSRGRLPGIGLAALLVATSVAWDGTLPGPTAAADASAAPAAAVDLTLPDDGARAADSGLTVTDTPVPPTELALDEVLEAAYGGAEALPLADWDVTALAQALGTDPRAAFAFVRDSIRYDPYRGVLRGADGTLAARSGNASDRALLLHDLLAAMGVSSRFAFGTLAPEVAASLVDHAFDRLVAPLPDAAGLTFAALDGAAIEQRARRDYARLRTALGDRMDAMAPVSIQSALMDVTPHTWLQVDEAGTWVDYDPSLPDATPGQTLTTATKTPDAMPVEEQQAVTIRVISETLWSDGIYDELLLEQRLDAASAAESSIFLYFQPDGGGSGLSPFDSVGAAAAWVPVLMVDGVAQAGVPFPIGGGEDGGGGGGGGFADFGGALGGGAFPPALLSLRLSVAREVPGQPPREATHVLLDRVSGEARAAGAIDPTLLPALPEGPGGPLAFGTIHHVLVSTGGADARLQAIDQGLSATFLAEELLVDGGTDGYPLSDILIPVAVANQALVVASERAVVPAVDAVDGLRSFIGRPRVYIASVGPTELGPDGVMFQTDLLVDGVNTIARAGADIAAAPASQVWYGVLQGALETEFGRALARGLQPEGRRTIGVSQAMGMPLEVIGVNEFGTLTSASPALVGAVAAGQLAVVPGDPNTAQAWWTVDATTGATRAVIDPGLGGQFNSGGGTKAINSGQSQRYDISTPKKAKTLPKGKCDRGNEYLIIIGCVSTPVYWAIVTTFVVVVLSAISIGILFALTRLTRASHPGGLAIARDRLLETKPA